MRPTSWSMTRLRDTDPVRHEETSISTSIVASQMEDVVGMKSGGKTSVANKMNKMTIPKTVECGWLSLSHSLASLLS